MQCARRAIGDAEATTIAGFGIQPQGILVEDPCASGAGFDAGAAVSLFDLCMYTGFAIDFGKAEFPVDEARQGRTGFCPHDEAYFFRVWM